MGRPWLRPLSGVVCGAVPLGCLPAGRLMTNVLGYLACDAPPDTPLDCPLPPPPPLYVHRHDLPRLSTVYSSRGASLDESTGDPRCASPAAGGRH